MISEEPPQYIEQYERIEDILLIKINKDTYNTLITKRTEQNAILYHIKPGKEYRMKTPQVDLHIELEANDKLVSRKFFVEDHLQEEGGDKWGKDQRRDQMGDTSNQTEHKSCYFHGKVKGYTRSSVALTNCKGVVILLLSLVIESFFLIDKNHCYQYT